MPRRINRTLKRSQFVAAARRIIRRRGLAAATLRRVAAEANCTTGSLTHYFSNREALLIAALRDSHGAAAARMASAAANAREGLPRLEAIVLEALPLDGDRMEVWKTRLAFWGALGGSEALRRENARRFAQWNEFLRRHLAALVPDRETLRREVILLAALVDGLAMRLVTECRTPEQIRAATPEIAAAVRLHLRALRHRYA